MTLALFDLDNTLIAGDSDYLWGEFLVSRRLVDVKAYRKANEDFYQDYVDGTLDVEDYLRFALKPLTQIAPEKLQQLHMEFMAESIQPIWLADAEALIKKHRAAGDKMAVITATNRFVVQPIVERLGIDSLICSEPELVDGAYTGNFIGTPCFADGKVDKILQWLQEINLPLAALEQAWFYSDSHNDLPLLGKVGKPVAVDPDDKLRAEAESRGWSVISLR